MKPSGHASVMQSRAPGGVDADTARLALLRKLEYFPTPPWAARAGAELIARLDPHPGWGGASGLPRPAFLKAGAGWWCWEPACGEGHMAAGLAEGFAAVNATDIRDYTADAAAGLGSCARAGLLQNRALDFLSPSGEAVASADWIVCNPPFPLVAKFVETSLRRARRGVAILARAALLESAGRYPLFFGATRPMGEPRPRLAVYAPFIERVAMTLGGWDPKASTATAYAWFVWMHDEVRQASPIGRQSQYPVVVPIPPGSRERLTRPTDARDWGRRGDAGLFEEAGR